MSAPTPPTGATQAVCIQACRHCGAGAPPDAHFCPQCDKILTLARHGDYFTFLDLPRRLVLDQRGLDDRLRALSRQFHPDYYGRATAAERLASLERSSYLNDAYRVLKNPVTRVEYLLKLEGMAPKTRQEASAQVPPGLLEEVFEFNEAIEDARGLRETGAPEAEIEARLHEVRTQVERRQASHAGRLAGLAEAWDRLVDAGAPASERRPVLEALRAWLLEEAYVANLLAAVDREFGEAR